MLCGPRTCLCPPVPTGGRDLGDPCNSPVSQKAAHFSIYRIRTGQCVQILSVSLSLSLLSTPPPTNNTSGRSVPSSKDSHTSCLRPHLAQFNTRPNLCICSAKNKVPPDGPFVLAGGRG